MIPLARPQVRATKLIPAAGLETNEQLHSIGSVVTENETDEPPASASAHLPDLALGQDVAAVAAALLSCIKRSFPPSQAHGSAVTTSERGYQCGPSGGT